jgi:hypothetical protein
MGGGADCEGITISPTNLIDDMEEDSPCILTGGSPPRAGCWYTFNDGTDGGVQTPPAGAQVVPSLITDPDGGRCGSMNAMHTFGSGFTCCYGAGLGFDLNHPTAGAEMPYDVSGFTGIAFWALGPTSGATQHIQVQILEQATTAVGGGGTCTTSCGDHYFFNVTLPPASAGWKQYQVPLYTTDAGVTGLMQMGFGPAAWDPKTVLGVQFAVNKAPELDFWIDDIGFF